MTQTHPDLRTTPAPWTPAPRGVHWADAPARPAVPVPPAGLGWAGYGWPTPPQRPGMRWGWIVLGVVAAVVAVAIIGTVAQQTSRMTVNGSVTVYGAAAQAGAACQDTAMTGKPISLFGANGDLVGTTSLTGHGVAVNEWNVSSSGNEADSCRFSFTLTDVTAADDYYRVTAGSDITDSVGFSKAQLQTSGADITYGHQ